MNIINNFNLCFATMGVMSAIGRWILDSLIKAKRIIPINQTVAKHKLQLKYGGIKWKIIVYTKNFP